MEVALLALRGVGRIIYDYQTLIAGMIALGAALIAARPVWRQLALTQTQANGVLRDMLLHRQAELAKAYAALAQRVGKPLNALDFELHEPDGELVELSAQQAHHYDQTAAHASAWLRSESDERDSTSVEQAKKTLAETLSKLASVLEDIHRPESTDQQGDDYIISDDDWAKIVAAGETAKADVPAALKEAQEALREAFAALAKEQESIRARLKRVDESLLERA